MVPSDSAEVVNNNCNHPPFPASQQALSAVRTMLCWTEGGNKVCANLAGVGGVVVGQLGESEVVGAGGAAAEVLALGAACTRTEFTWAAGWLHLQARG